MNKTEDKIEIAINKIMGDFEEYPDRYLTESDVRCVLVNELMSIPELNRIQDTRDNSESIPLHTEVRWYGQSGKLRWRSDIVIIDVNTLKVKNDVFKLPSKGFSFNNPIAIIEIKFRRRNGKANSAFILDIKRDVDKLKGIKREIPGTYFCGLVIFDKKEDICTKISKEDIDFKVYYKAAVAQV